MITIFSFADYDPYSNRRMLPITGHPILDAVLSDLVWGAIIIGIGVLYAFLCRDK
jgi:hypothetical protein